jgi:ribonuclease HI
MAAEMPAANRKLVTIYTDGACLGNPGPGGWSAILIYGKTEKELTGGEELTTNNRMELMAVIEGLGALKEPCVVHVFSDSRYVVDAFQKRWLKEWELRGWRKADGKPVKNDDLWQRLLSHTSGHEVVFHHVSGHSGHEYNERCDRLAQATAEHISKKQKKQVK